MTKVSNTLSYSITLEALFYSKERPPARPSLAFPEDPSPCLVTPKRAENCSVHNPTPADWHQQTHSAGQCQDMPTDRLAEWLVYTHIAASVPTQTILEENTLTRDISRNSTALMVQTLGTCMDQRSQMQPSPMSSHLVKRQRQTTFHSVTLPNTQEPIFLYLSALTHLYDMSTYTVCLSKK